MPTLTPFVEEDAALEHHMAHLEDGHWTPPHRRQSSTSTHRAGDAALDALDEEPSLECADWDRFWDDHGGRIR